MQASELYRRAIVAPMDKAAEIALQQNDINELSKLDILSMTDESLFMAVWNSGMFSRINAVCSSCIDDYEECLLSIDQLDTAMDILQNEFLKHPESNVSQFAKELHHLLMRARSRRSPVMFVL